MASTAPSDPVPALAKNAVSWVPFALSLNMLPRVVPFHVPVEENPVPTRILPSACTTTVRIKRADPVPVLVENAVSRVPSAFSRTILPTVVPFHVVNPPPTRILPSVCTATGWTPPPAPVPMLAMNAVSRVPSAFSRTILPTVAPFHVVKSPPTRILPSVWTVVALTVLFAPVPMLAMNAVSRVPFALSLTILPTVVPLNVVNVPPAKVLPSDCTATHSTALPAPLAMSYLVNSPSLSPP